MLSIITLALIFFNCARSLTVPTHWDDMNAVDKPTSTYDPNASSAVIYPTFNRIIRVNPVVAPRHPRILYTPVTARGSFSPYAPPVPYRYPPKPPPPPYRLTSHFRPSAPILYPITQPIHPSQALKKMDKPPKKQRIQSVEPEDAEIIDVGDINRQQGAERLSKQEDFDIPERYLAPIRDPFGYDHNYEESKNAEESMEEDHDEVEDAEDSDEESEPVEGDEDDLPLDLHAERTDEEVPFDVPTKPLYPGEGKWAEKGKHKVYERPESHETSKDYEKPDGYDIFEENERYFKKARKEFPSESEQSQPKVKKKRKEYGNKDNYEVTEDTDEEHAHETHFTPTKTYIQTRKIHEKQVVPQEDAYKEASNYEEYVNAPFLKEVIKDLKKHVVYTEEGYEDSGYDHGGKEKQAESQEEFLNKEGEDARYREYLRKKNRDGYGQEKGMIRGEEQEGAYHEDNVRGTNKEYEDMRNYNDWGKSEDYLASDGSEKTFKKIPAVSSVIPHAQGSPRNAQGTPLPKEVKEKDNWIKTNIQETLQTTVINKPKDPKRKGKGKKTLSQKKTDPKAIAWTRFNETLPKPKLLRTKRTIKKRRRTRKRRRNKTNRALETRTTPVFFKNHDDSDFNTPPLEKITHINPQNLAESYKYPYYRLPDQIVSPNSPLRYAENIFNHPRKTGTGMEFYESMRDVHCADVEDEVDPVPEHVKHQNGTGVNGESPSQRLVGLGDKIECLRAKYFGVEPLDSPFFNEGPIGQPKPLFKALEQALKSGRERPFAILGGVSTAGALGVKDSINSILMDEEKEEESPRKKTSKEESSRKKSSKEESSREETVPDHVQDRKMKESVEGSRANEPKRTVNRPIETLNIKTHTKNQPKEVEIKQYKKMKESVEGSRVKEPKRTVNRPIETLDIKTYTNNKPKEKVEIKQVKRMNVTSYREETPNGDDMAREETRHDSRTLNEMRKMKNLNWLTGYLNDHVRHKDDVKVARSEGTIKRSKRYVIGKKEETKRRKRSIFDDIFNFNAMVFIEEHIDEPTRTDDQWSSLPSQSLPSPRSIARPIEAEPDHSYLTNILSSVEPPPKISDLFLNHYSRIKVRSVGMDPERSRSGSLKSGAIEKRKKGFMKPSPTEDLFVNHYSRMKVRSVGMDPERSVSSSWKPRAIEKKEKGSTKPSPIEKREISKGQAYDDEPITHLEQADAEELVGLPKNDKDIFIIIDTNNFDVPIKLPLTHDAPFTNTSTMKSNYDFQKMKEAGKNSQMQVYSDIIHHLTSPEYKTFGPTSERTAVKKIKMKIPSKKFHVKRPDESLLVSSSNKNEDIDGASSEDIDGRIVSRIRMEKNKKTQNIFVKDDDRVMHKTYEVKEKDADSQEMAEDEESDDEYEDNYKADVEAVDPAPIPEALRYDLIFNQLENSFFLKPVRVQSYRSNFNSVNTLNTLNSLNHLHTPIPNQYQPPVAGHQPYEKVIVRNLKPIQHANGFKLAIPHAQVPPNFYQRLVSPFMRLMQSFYRPNVYRVIVRPKDVVRIVQPSPIIIANPSGPAYQSTYPVRYSAYRNNYEMSNYYSGVPHGPGEGYGYSNVRPVTSPYDPRYNPTLRGDSMPMENTYRRVSPNGGFKTQNLIVEASKRVDRDVTEPKRSKSKPYNEFHRFNRPANSYPKQTSQIYEVAEEASTPVRVLADLLQSNQYLRSRLIGFPHVTHIGTTVLKGDVKDLLTDPIIHKGSTERPDVLERIRMGRVRPHEPPQELESTSEDTNGRGTVELVELVEINNLAGLEDPHSPKNDRKSSNATEQRRFRERKPEGSSVNTSSLGLAVKNGNLKTLRSRQFRPKDSPGRRKGPESSLTPPNRTSVDVLETVLSPLDVNRHLLDVAKRSIPDVKNYSSRYYESRGFDTPGSVVFLIKPYAGVELSDPRGFQPMSVDQLNPSLLDRAQVVADLTSKGFGANGARGVEYTGSARSRPETDYTELVEFIVPKERVLTGPKHGGNYRRVNESDLDAANTRSDVRTDDGDYEDGEEEGFDEE